MLSAGDTFLCPIRIEWVDHLWVVVIDPEPSGTTIIVNVTTREPYHTDLAVVLNVGDHPFITHESILNYGFSLITNVNPIEQAIQGGLGRQREPCSPQLLARIQQGLLSSPFTPIKVETYYRTRQGP